FDAALSGARAAAVVRQFARPRQDGARDAGRRRSRGDRHARHRAGRGGPLMLESIRNYLSSGITPGEAGSQFWATIYIIAITLGVSLAVISMNWLERKIMAHMQIRLGPMRVGPHGLLQPIADALKLLIKEDIIPANADKLVFWSAPVVVTMTAFTTFLVVPFGPTHA